MLADYGWSIYETVVSNLSDILALIGIGIAIRESRKAKSAAMAAELAANQTKIKFKVIEMSILVQECIHESHNLIKNADTDNWEAASEIASKIRKNLVSIKYSNESGLNETISNKISETIIQFKIINQSSDRALNRSNKAQNKVGIKTIIREQIDNLVEIHQHTKNALGTHK